MCLNVNPNANVDGNVASGSFHGGIGLFVLLLFYAISTIFQLYLVSDMMYEMRRRKPKPTLLPTQEIFNLHHHIGMIKL